MTYGPDRDGDELQHPQPPVPRRLHHDESLTQKQGSSDPEWSRNFVVRFGISLLGLSGGFVAGNLTGTGLSLLRGVGIWDGFSLMLTLMALEALDYSGTRTRVPRGVRRGLPTAGPTTTFKLGLLFGTFTDAFKVGS